METHQCGLFVAYCVPKLSEGPAPARQMVPIATWCHEINNGNGEGAAVGIPHSLSKVFLVRGWLVKLVHRIILLLILFFWWGTAGQVFGLGVVQGWVCIRGRGWNSWSMWVLAVCETIILDLAASCIFLETCFIDTVRDEPVSAVSVWVRILLVGSREFYWLEDDVGAFASKKDPWQSQGRDF